MGRRRKESNVKIGDRFDKLEVVEKVDIPIMRKIKDENGNTYKEPTGKTKIGWFCKCDCGGTIILPEVTLLSKRSSLRSCNSCPPEENPNHVSKRMSFEQKQEWDELYKYVRKNILRYDESLPLSDFIVTRLKGLLHGKYIANNKVKNNANYSYSTVLNTFKFCNQDIQKALMSNNFNNEQHKFNYIAKIIENNINEVYMKMKKAEKVQREIEKADLSYVAEYKDTFKRKERKINNRLKDLL